MTDAVFKARELQGISQLKLSRAHSLEECNTQVADKQKPLEREAEEPLTLLSAKTGSCIRHSLVRLTRANPRPSFHDGRYVY